MRVVVTGATGNVGSSLVRRLQADSEIDEVVGIVRRPPGPSDEGMRWVSADLRDADLVPIVRDADAVVHLAWLIQPSRDEAKLWDVNVLGTERLLAAIARGGVRNLVYASSIGAYSPGPKDDPVAESWPTHGIATSTYSRQKAYVERLLDRFELEYPEVRVTRLRPGLIFKREAASEIRRFFLGSLFPNRVVARGRVPLFPVVEGLAFQTVHTEDVAEVYHRAVRQPEHGAFNVAAEPVLTLADVARTLEARPISVPAGVLRPGAAVTWRLRLHPVEPGWIDLAFRSPVMDTRRVREVFGWEPEHSARDAVAELLAGLRRGAGGDTPTLQPDRERSRVRELGTGQGARYDTDDVGAATETPGA